MNHEWITLHADNFHIGTQIQVTGGRIWSVSEEHTPRKDTSFIPPSVDLPHVFVSGNETPRKSIRSRRNDVEIWTF